MIIYVLITNRLITLLSINIFITFKVLYLISESQIVTITKKKIVFRIIGVIKRQARFVGCQGYFELLNTKSIANRMIIMRMCIDNILDINILLLDKIVTIQPNFRV